VQRLEESLGASRSWKKQGSVSSPEDSGRAPFSLNIRLETIFLPSRPASYL
jgi:hypothetical protein